MGRFSLYCRKVMVMSCLLVPVMARAELTVIYDSGNTQSIAPFLDVFRIDRRHCHSKVRFR